MTSNPHHQFDGSLSAIIKYYRLARPSLASAMDVSLQTIHNWCTGRVPVPVHHLGALSEHIVAAGATDTEVAALIQRQLELHGLDHELLQGLRADRQPSVGVGAVMLITWDMKSGGIFQHFTKATREAIESLGLICLVMDCGGDHRMRQTYIREAIRMQAHGVILAGVPGAYPAPSDDLLTAIQPLVEHHVPTVMLTPWNGDISLPAGVIAVGWESDTANEMALSFLKESGHERIAVVLGETGPLVGGRYQGLDRTFADLGMPIDKQSIAWLDGDADDVAEVQRCLERTTAVFARTSTLATVANACHAANLRWPRDISVITLGHPQSLAQLSSHPFTYVGIPVGKISRAAAHLLASMVDEDDFHYSHQFVVYGRSTMRVMNPEGGSVGAPGSRLTHSTP
jgi:DNA-binding LacI/PurR family transcriptional regulator